MLDVIELTKQLIKYKSITPDDHGCQQFIAGILKNLGFHVQYINFEPVSNLWAYYGEPHDVFTFLGHTDVVPTGAIESWQHDPFEGVVTNSHIYGRGTTDMKGSIAAMLCAIEQILLQHKNSCQQSLGILLTSTEEGDSSLGIPKALAALQKSGVTFSSCLVGEPSSGQRCGDAIKIGRRGSLTANLTLHGKQGHIAYPEKALNPIHNALEFLNELIIHKWDQPHPEFPATQCQISNIRSGLGVSNVIPAELTLQCNWRYSPTTSAELIKQQLEKLLQQHQQHYHIEWQHSALPYYSRPGQLRKTCMESIYEVTQQQPEVNCQGGTSDGRFMAELGIEVIEFGSCNQTMHQINERIAIKDIKQLQNIYQHIVQRMCFEKSTQPITT